MEKSSAHWKTLACEMGLSNGARVEVLGVVVYRENRDEKFVRFAIDDGTGCVTCVLWVNHVSARYFSGRAKEECWLLADLARFFASEVEVGCLVRVRGRIARFRGEVQVTVSDLVVETNDPNAEILHWLECLRLARRTAAASTLAVA